MPDLEKSYIESEVRTLCESGDDCIEENNYLLALELYIEALELTTKDRKKYFEIRWSVLIRMVMITFGLELYDEHEELIQKLIKETEKYCSKDKEKRLYNLKILYTGAAFFKDEEEEFLNRLAEIQ